MGTTNIEWANKVWNPVTGCTKVSEGCRNCYAERMANRLRGRCGYPADEPFRVTLRPERLEEPLRWKKSAMIFVNSMGDLFHPEVPDEYIAKVWDAMWEAKQHIFLILTKRPERMKKWVQENAFAKQFGWTEEERVPFEPGNLIHIDDLWMRNMCGWAAPGKCDCNNGYICGYPVDKYSEQCEHGNRLCLSWNCPIAYDDPPEEVLEANGLGGQYDIDDEGISIDCDWMQLHTRPRYAFVKNVWLGVTCENQQAADDRIPILLQIPAAVRFVSCEPLLGPIDLAKWMYCKGEYGELLPGFKCKGCDTPVMCMSYNPVLDWIIVGGETGPGARPMHPEWVRSLRDQCQTAGVPFFFKGWGEWAPVRRNNDTNQIYVSDGLFVTAKKFACLDKQGRDVLDLPGLWNEGVDMAFVGKKVAGDILDGKQYHECPEVQSCRR